MQSLLQPGTAQLIRDALGQDANLLPDVVPTALARLAGEAPAVHSRVPAEVSGTAIRLGSGRVLERSRRWGALSRRLFWWGDGDVGDRLVATRHVAAAAPLGVAGLFLRRGCTWRHRSPACPAATWEIAAGASIVILLTEAP